MLSILLLYCVDYWMLSLKFSSVLNSALGLRQHRCDNAWPCLDIETLTFSKKFLSMKLYYVVAELTNCYVPSSGLYAKMLSSAHLTWPATFSTHWSVATADTYRTKSTLETPFPANNIVMYKIGFVFFGNTNICLFSHENRKESTKPYPPIFPFYYIFLHLYRMFVFLYFLFLKKCEITTK